MLMPSVMSTCVRTHSTHMPLGFGCIGIAHRQHSTLRASRAPSLAGGAPNIATRGAKCARRLAAAMIRALTMEHRDGARADGADRRRAPASGARALDKSQDDALLARGFDFVDAGVDAGDDVVDGDGGAEGVEREFGKPKRT